MNLLIRRDLLGRSRPGKATIKFYLSLENKIEAIKTRPVSICRDNEYIFGLEINQHCRQVYDFVRKPAYIFLADMDVVLETAQLKAKYHPYFTAPPQEPLLPPPAVAMPIAAAFSVRPRSPNTSFHRIM